MTSTEDPKSGVDSDSQTGPARRSPATVKASAPGKTTPRRSSPARAKTVSGQSSKGIVADAYESGQRVWPD